MWYIVYNQMTGAMVSIASEGNVANPLPPDLAVVPYEQQPDLTRNRWDPEQRMLVPITPAVRGLISRQTFLDRIGPDAEEEIQFFSVERAGDPVELARAKAKLRAWMLRFTIVGEVDVLDPRTIAGVDILIGGGLLDPARRDAVLALPQG